MGCAFNTNNKNHDHSINSIVYTNEEHTINFIVYLKILIRTSTIFTCLCWITRYFYLPKVISNGHFIIWSGIDKVNFNDLLKTTIAIAKGNLDQERKNLQSTKQTVEIRLVMIK